MEPKEQTNDKECGESSNSTLFSFICCRWIVVFRAGTFAPAERHRWLFGDVLQLMQFGKAPRSFKILVGMHDEHGMCDNMFCKAPFL